MQRLIACARERGPLAPVRLLVVVRDAEIRDQLVTMLAAGGSGDIRDIALGSTVERKPSGGLVSRLMSALKQGY